MNVDQKIERALEGYIAGKPADVDLRNALIAARDEIASLRERLRETQHALLNDDVAEARAIVDAALAETEVSDV